MVFSEQRAMRLDTEEIRRRGMAIYADQLREPLDTPENLGRFLAIDIDTGDYQVGERLEATQALRLRRPDAVVYLMKIGYPAAVTMSGSLRPLPR